MLREIVRIDEDKCNGCGVCVPNCHEGALQVIDGKARLISELMCDGLGACIGHCPEGAITIEKREAEAYDEVAVIAGMVQMGKNTVFAHLKHLQDHGETGYLRQATEWLRGHREQLPFTIAEVHALLHGQAGATASGSSSSVSQGAASGGGCPGSASRSFESPATSDLTPGATQRPSGAAPLFRMAPASGDTSPQPSELTHWPVQMHLINPAASHFQGADLLVAADCVAFSHGDFHRTFLRGKKLAIACPKLDQNLDVYLRKLVQLIDEARVNTITTTIMEVPCCGGLLRLINQARSMASRNVPLKVIVVSSRGQILREEWT